MDKFRLPGGASRGPLGKATHPSQRRPGGTQAADDQAALDVGQFTGVVMFVIVR